MGLAGFPSVKEGHVGVQSTRRSIQAKNRGRAQGRHTIRSQWGGFDSVKKSWRSILEMKEKEEKPKTKDTAMS